MLVPLPGADSNFYFPPMMSTRSRMPQLRIKPPGQRGLFTWKITQKCIFFKIKFCFDVNFLGPIFNIDV